MKTRRGYSRPNLCVVCYDGLVKTRFNALNRHTQGLILGSITAVSFAVYVLINRLVYTNYDVDTLVYLVTFFVAGGLFGAIALYREKTKVPRITAMPVISNGLLTAIGLGIFVYGQSQTTAVNASIIATSSMLTTIIYSRYLLGERLTRGQIVWMTVMFGGLYIAIVGLRGVALNRGDLIVLASSLILGFTNTFSKTLMKKAPSSYIANIRIFAGGVFFIVAGLIFNDQLIASEAGLWPLAAGFVFWLTISSFYKTIELLNPTEAIVIANSQAIIAPFFGFLLLNEPYGLNKIAGAGLILFSIYKISLAARRNMNVSSG